MARVCGWGGQLAHELAEMGGGNLVRMRHLLEERREPLEQLGPKTRKLFPPSHVHYVRAVLRNMTAAGFAPDEVGTLLAAVYRARKPGALTRKAVDKAWRVLVTQAPHFSDLDDRILKLVRADHGRQEALPTDECARMLTLLAGPLMPDTQLHAIFAAFDANLDGEISPEELHSVLRIINPLGRTAAVQELAPKKPPPGLAERTAQVGEWVHQRAKPHLKQLDKQLGVLGDRLAQHTGALALKPPPEEGEGDQGGVGEGAGEGGAQEGGETVLGDAEALMKELAGDAEEEENDGVEQLAGPTRLQPFGRKKKPARRGSTFDTNQALANKWQQNMPDFAYG